MEKDMKEICLFGTKQSGKTTTATAIYGYIAVQKEVVPVVKFNDQGEMFVEYADGTGFKFDIDTQEENIRTFYAHNVYKYVMHASYADKLKHVVSLMFGVPLEKLYGSDDDKNSPSEITWKMMNKLVDTSYYKGKHKVNDPMTYRQLLEVFGTDVLRVIDPDVHIKGAFKTLEKWQPEVAILPDGRFLNEFEFCEKRKLADPDNVCLIKHSRSVLKSSAKSENGLKNIDNDRYDLIVPDDLNMIEKNELVIKYLVDNNFLENKKVKIDHASTVS